MPKLTDTQAILLSTASQRDDGSLLPPPETLGAVTPRIRKAVETLIKRALAAEIEMTATDRAWRSAGDQHWGVTITDAGKAAIGIEQAGAAEDKATLAATNDVPAATNTTSIPTTPPEQKPTTKAALVLTMLRRAEGATLTELIGATGWLPHTTRAALTGLRKKGHEIAKGKRNEVTCYTLAGAA
jgi:hypothetical protein